MNNASRDRDGWVDLCAVSDIPADCGCYVLHENKALAVFLDETGQARVMDDACPHAGASLSGGHVEEGCVVCPWHGWVFDLGDGCCPDNPVIKVGTYATRVEGGRVWAKVD